jgi:hypothetical protein
MSNEFSHKEGRLHLNGVLFCGCIRFRNGKGYEKYSCGVLHSLDGPALVRRNVKSYYILGSMYSESAYNDLVSHIESIGMPAYLWWRWKMMNIDMSRKGRNK